MNQRRRIFFIIFGVYHLVILIFVLFIEAQKEDLGLLYGLYSKIWVMRYGAMLGVLLFVVDFIWNWIETRDRGREKDVMRHENNTLKAKVYDLQQPAKEPVKESSAGAKS
jgi:hypothetical protein